MNNYSYKSIVSNTEADALKEMIFKRARERAEALTEETQTSYTTAVHADIMDLARNSLASDKNPFVTESTPMKEVFSTDSETEVENKDRNIGFSQRKMPEIKARIENNNSATTETLVASAVQANMAEAREGLYKKQSFVGALEFLNSQATITLIKNKGKVFEAMA